MTTETEVRRKGTHRARRVYAKAPCECGEVVSVGGMQRAAHERGWKHRVRMNAKMKAAFDGLTLRTDDTLLRDGLPDCALVAQQFRSLLDDNPDLVMRSHWHRRPWVDSRRLDSLRVCFRQMRAKFNP